MIGRLQKVTHPRLGVRARIASPTGKSRSRAPSSIRRPKATLVEHAKRGPVPGFSVRVVGRVIGNREPVTGQTDLHGCAPRPLKPTTHPQTDVSGTLLHVADPRSYVPQPRARMPTLPNQQSPEGSACHVDNVSFWYGSAGMPADRDLPPDRRECARSP